MHIGTPVPTAAPVLQGLFVLAALLMIWFEVKRPTDHEVATLTPPLWRSGDFACVLVLGLTYVDFFPLLRSAFTMPGYLPGDASSHALVAMHLFDGGLLPHWSEQFVGGFPIAIHYPLLGWLLTSVPMKLGVDPTLSTLSMGYLALLSLPPLLYLLARYNGAHFVPSLGSALALQWLSPQSPFVGNIDTFARTGLLSQAISAPILLIWAFTLLGRGTTPRAISLSILCVLAHPQIATSASLILGLGVVVTGNRLLIRRYVLSQCAATLVAGCVYGPGIVSMGLPFGWPDIPQWMHLGFGPEKLHPWLVEGELIDCDRPPLLTAIWLASVLVLASRFRREASARAGVVTSSIGLLLCIVGPPLAHSGRLGLVIVSVFQPLRTMACMPLIVGGTVLVAFETLRSAPAHWVAAILRACGDGVCTRWNSCSARLRSGLILLGTAPVWFPIATTLRDSRRWTLALWQAEFARYTPELPCGPMGPTRAEVTALKAGLSRLKGGRLWIDKGPGSIVGVCTMTTGLERHASVPLATTDAVGAHVALLQEANLRLEPREPGLATRAEALGLRYLLVSEPLTDDAAKGFELLDHFGPIRLYERTTPFNYFGLGCIRVQMNGRTDALQATLTKAFRSTEGRNFHLAPSRTVALEVADHFAIEPLAADDCRADSAASLNEVPRPTGQYAAILDTTTDVTVILRATAHPRWNFSANGQPLKPRLVSPGYYAIHLGPGHHAIEANFRSSPLVPFGFLLALVLPCLAAAVNRTTKNGLHPARR